MQIMSHTPYARLISSRKNADDLKAQRIRKLWSGKQPQFPTVNSNKFLDSEFDPTIKTSELMYD